MAARRDIEGPLHRAILGYLRTVLPDALVHHSANEIGLSGKAVERQIAKAKWNGMVPGWPDLEVLTDTGSLFLEVKAPGNYPTPDQRAVHERMAGLGYRVAVVRSIDDVRAALAGWGVVTVEVTR